MNKDKKIVRKLKNPRQEQEKWNSVLKIVNNVCDLYRLQFPTYRDTEFLFEKAIEDLNIDLYTNLFKPVKITQYGKYISLKYKTEEMTNELWNSDFYRECRGLVIDINRGEIVCSPYRKFFNLNELEECSFDNIINAMAKADTVEFTDKLDGSMQSARFYYGKYLLNGMSEMNIKESWRLQTGMRLMGENYKRMLRDNADCTFIFELIAYKDRHTVLYDKDELVLTGIRDVNTGYTYNNNLVKLIADTYNVPSAVIEKKTITEVLAEAKVLPSNEKEGWVLNIDGYRVKIKCDDYVQISRVLGTYSSDNAIVKAIADGTMDDVLSKVPSNYIKRIKEDFSFYKGVKLFLDKKIDEYYNKAPKGNKKDFMVYVNNNVPKEISGYVRCKYLKTEYNIFKKGKDGYKKAKEVKEMADRVSAFIMDDDLPF